MRSKVPPPAVRHFLVFPLILYNPTLVFHLFLFGFFICMLEWVVLVRIPSLRCTHGLIYFLQMCPRTFVYRASPPPHRMFPSRTSVLRLTFKFCWPSQTPIAMTTPILSLHTPLILMCLDPLTTRHILRTSTLPKTDLEWMNSIFNRPPILPSW